MGKISLVNKVRPHGLSKPAAIVGVFAAITLLAFTACTRGDGLSDLERRAYEINQTVMCPVCPGESIDQSQNPLAVKMRGIVLNRLQQGWTEQQIKDHFVDSYGDSVLLSPPSKGFSLLIWILPPVGIVTAAAALMFALRAMTKGREVSEALDAIELTESERLAYTERINRLISNEKDGESS